MSRKDNSSPLHLSREAKALHGSDGRQTWSEENSNGLQILIFCFFVLCRASEKLHGNGYALIPYMAEFYSSTLRTDFRIAKPSKHFPKEGYNESHESVWSTIAGKDVLSDAADKVLGAPIINIGWTVTDEPDWSTSSSRFTSLSTLFTSWLETTTYLGLLFPEPRRISIKDGSRSC